VQVGQAGDDDGVVTVIISGAGPQCGWGRAGGRWGWGHVGHEVWVWVQVCAWLNVIVVIVISVVDGALRPWGGPVCT
jgi:hypothetical protein